MEHLNISVAGSWMVSIPMKTRLQKEASARISQGLRDGHTFIVLEPKARKCPKTN